MNKFNINTGKKIKNSKKELIGYTSSLSAAISYGISAILAKIIVGQITTPLIASSFALFFGFFILSITFGDSAAKISSKSIMDGSPMRARAIDNFFCWPWLRL